MQTRYVVNGRQVSKEIYYRYFTAENFNVYRMDDDSLIVYEANGSLTY